MQDEERRNKQKTADAIKKFNSRITRRGLLQTAAMAGAGIAAPYVFVPRALAQRAKELVVVHAGGVNADANRAAYFEPFSKETGIKIVEETGPWMEKLKAQADAGKVNWDVMVDIGAFRMLQGVTQDLLQKLDYNVITNTKDLIPNAVHPYGVGSNVGSEVIAYNTKKYSRNDHPKNWAEFFDTKKFPGVRAMYQKAYGNLEVALLADGVPPEKLYPLDVDRAFKKLTQVKPEIGVWTTTFDQVIRLLTDGEVDVGMSWNARVSFAAEAGAPIALEWNQGFWYLDVLSVPKGAPNPTAAMQLINFMLDAQRQAKYASIHPYGPSNMKAIPLIPEAKRAFLPTDPKNLEKQLAFGDNFWETQLTPLTAKFQLWLAQKS